MENRILMTISRTRIQNLVGTYRERWAGTTGPMTNATKVIFNEEDDKARQARELIDENTIKDLK